MGKSGSDHGRHRGVKAGHTAEEHHLAAKDAAVRIEPGTCLREIGRDGVAATGGAAG